MKKYYLLIFTILIVLTANGQNWVNVTLDYKINVNFPSIPEINDVNGWKQHFVKNDDYQLQGIYMRMPKHVESNAEEIDLDKFYDSYIKGSLDSTGNPNLLYNKAISLDSHIGREISFIRDYKGENGITLVEVVKKVFFIDKVIFEFSIFKLSKNNNDDIFQKFFESIKLIN